MHPILVSAVASTAENILDRWARRSGDSRATAAAPQADFQTVMDGKKGRASATTAAKSAADVQRDRITKLRADLLDAPEVRAVLDTADPTKPPTLSLTTDGRLLVRQAGYDSKPILLSPESAAAARELASLTAAPAGSSISAQIAPGSAAQNLRSTDFVLAPQTSLTALR